MPDVSRAALIVGVDAYYHIAKELPSCKKDALDLHELLTRSEYGYTIFGGKPILGSNLPFGEGYKSIQESVKNFFQNAEAGQTLLFYFSGHGIPHHGQIYLATPEMDPQSPMFVGLNLSDLTVLINNSRSTRIVCIIDACYSGAATLVTHNLVDKAAAETEAQEAVGIYDKINEDVPIAEGKCLLLSSQAYQKSRAEEDKNGIYTKYLLIGLQGTRQTTDEKGIPIPSSVDESGNVTPQTLHEYIYNRVANELKTQTPRIKSSLSSKIILVKHSQLATNPGDSSSPKGDIGKLMDEGREYFDYGEYSIAIDYYDKVIALNPNHARAWYNKGQALQELRRYNEAIESYNRALDIQPKYFNVLHEKGNALYRLAKYDEAITSYDMALKIDPDNSSVLKNKMLAVNELSKSKKSEPPVEPANVTNATSIIDQGDGYFSKGDYDSAIEYYDKALKIDPEQIKAWNNKGLALHNLGRYDAAIECYNKSLQVDPTDFSASYNKGLTLHKLGRYDEALECYEQALTIDPDNTSVINNRELLFEEHFKDAPHGEEDVQEFSNTHTYKGIKINLSSLVSSVVLYLQDKGFKVNYSSDLSGPTHRFNIQATKTSKIRKFAGIRRSAKIIIIDKPQKFEISLTSGEWKKNVASSLATSIPLSIVTAGAYIPVAIGTAGATVFADKRFKDDFWKFVDNKIKELSSKYS